MPIERPTIFLIDDDASVRRALGRVMTSVGLESRSFASVEDFLAGVTLETRGCVVADMTLPGMGGLELKQALNAAHSTLPVILLSGHESEEMRASAHEAGAAGFFRKPVDTQALLDAIQWTLNPSTKA
jgi:FixJ family two-component response regulator